MGASGVGGSGGMRLEETPSGRDRISSGAAVRSDPLAASLAPPPAAPPTGNPSPIAGRRSARSSRGLVAALAVLVGCAHGGMGLWHDLEFDGPEGTELLAFTPQADGVELVDGYRDRFGTYALEDGVLRVLDGKRRELGFVRPVDGGETLELCRSRDGAVLFRFEREPDGDMRLEDASGTLLGKLKRRDDGYKIVDAGERERARVKERPGKTSLRDPTGQTRLATRDPLSAEAVACFAFDEIPLAFQGGCALAIRHWGFGG